MFKVIVVSVLFVSFSVRSSAENEPSRFCLVLEEAIRSYLQEATSAVLVKDISTALVREDVAGVINKNEWFRVTDSDYETLSKRFSSRTELSWRKSNMSVLAPEGGCLLVFCNNDGEALFGLIHWFRWDADQFQIAMVSGNLRESLSLEGIVSISVIDRNRKNIRDVPLVIGVGELDLEFMKNFKRLSE
jgi:hypothetical protein